MVEYPPYVDAYGQIKTLFEKIREAAVPTKFTNDFIYSILSLKSNSYRPMISLLKKLGFINEAQVPTIDYRDYRDPSKSKVVMAKKIKDAYKGLYTAAEYAHKLKKEEITTKLISVLGTSKEDKTIPKVTSTFIELCKLADFDIKESLKDEKKVNEIIKDEEDTYSTTKLGISYTINLNLPATSDIEVFNAIFKSLKENLLK